VSERLFPGRVDDSGTRIVFEDPAQYVATRRKLAGKRVEVILRKPKSKRSLAQNDYAHKWPFPLIAEAMGEGVEAAKLCILGEKFGWHEVMGKSLPIKPSTSKLTITEFDALIEWMPPWALDMFGIEIPLPNEVPCA
jgi:hypothetical protein